ncbi:MAG: hypothetical protein DRQ14_04985 [Candidatus Latescibacterota bacterium]|nr:MAG: hypothetical protein DRQ14_04985 [Candidatus Latescibacterota bacterium]
MTTTSVCQGLPPLLRAQLEVLYSQVPATECDNCGRCCGLSEEERRAGWVTMYPLYAIEYLNILDFIRTELPEKEDLLNFREEWPLRCPFRDDSLPGCIIYPVRPLVCRTYGVLGEEEIEEAIRRFGRGMPASWIEIFRRWEGSLVCPRVRVTEPEKLLHYMEGRIHYRYMATIEKLNEWVWLPQEERREEFRRISGKERVSRWTWGGFNALTLSPDDWFREEFPAYWRASKLAR